MTPSEPTTDRVTDASPRAAAPKPIGLLVIGDEILSGRRVDKHVPKVIEILAARGLALDHVRITGDDPARITRDLADALAADAVTFSCGGIGATPDDHTRACAAAALGRPLALHPEARDLVLERMRDVAREQGVPYEPDRADNRHRLEMAVFPEGARIVPNPYNKIAGFSLFGRDTGRAGDVHFVPGFPVMAWPMVEWVLDTHYAGWLAAPGISERSVVVYGAMEASLTPLMEAIERAHPPVKVFSLPSVDHPVHGRHIELGVKLPRPADAARLNAAWEQLLEGLRTFGAPLGPESVR